MAKIPPIASTPKRNSVVVPWFITSCLAITKINTSNTEPGVCLISIFKNSTPIKMENALFKYSENPLGCIASSIFCIKLITSEPTDPIKATDNTRPKSSSTLYNILNNTLENFFILFLLCQKKYG